MNKEERELLVGCSWLLVIAGAVIAFFVVVLALLVKLFLWVVQ